MTSQTVLYEHIGDKIHISQVSYTSPENYGFGVEGPLLPFVNRF